LKITHPKSKLRIKKIKIIIENQLVMNGALKIVANLFGISIASSHLRHPKKWGHSYWWDSAGFIKIEHYE